MKRSSTAINVIMILLLLLMIAAAITLYVIHDQFMPKTISPERNIRAKTSSPLIVTDEFLILVNPVHLEKLSTILDPLGLKLKMPLLNWLLVERAIMSKHQTALLGSDEARLARQTLNSLTEHPLILDAHHNYVMENTIFKEMSIMHNSQNNHLRMMNLESAWQHTTGSPQVSIGIVDNFSVQGRFNFASVFSDCVKRVQLFGELSSSSVPSFPSTTPHGEIMLQALGACNDSETLSTGIDKHAYFLVAEPATSGHAQYFLAALSLSGVNVCTSSIIACPSDIQPELPLRKLDVLLLPFGNDAPDLLQISADIIRAITNRGVIVVVGAGNNAQLASNFFPGGAPGVINVGALNTQGYRASFSNFGPTIDVLAPGEDIPFLFPNGAKTFFGSSLSAAYVAGTVALMKAKRPDLSSAMVEHIFRDTGHELSCEQYCADSLMDACEQACCDRMQLSCGKVGLDIGAAVVAAENFSNTPLLTLSNSYLIHVRDEHDPIEFVVENIGDASSDIEIISHHNTMNIVPQKFFLAAHEKQSVKISFTREPFIRQIFRFEALARVNSDIKDRREFYMEYIPKK